MSAIEDISMVKCQYSLHEVVAVVAASTCFGASLAWIGLIIGDTVGWVGALVLTGWALLAVRRWQARYERNGSELRAPERISWQGLLGYSAIFGHMAFYFFNPLIDIQVSASNFFAIDNGLLVLGMFANSIIVKANSEVRNERISAFLTGLAFLFLSGLMVTRHITVGSLQSNLQAILGHFVVVYLMVGTILLSLMIGQTCRPSPYAQDRVVT
jgi:hypothetical protein